MGLVVDTSVFIHAERSGVSVLSIFEELKGTGFLNISAVTLMELAHGVARAKVPALRRERELFLVAVRHNFAVIPLDGQIAVRAGILNGELNDRGYSVGLADAMIAATALLRGDGVATRNAKHFKLVPGLQVVEL